MSRTAMLILGSVAFGIIVLILIIAVLIQCGSKDKEKNTLENGEVGASEQYTPIDSTPESQNDQKQEVDCKIDVETKEKSASLKPDKLVSSFPPRPPPSSLKKPDNNQQQESYATDKSADNNAPNLMTTTHENQAPSLKGTVKSVDSKPNGENNEIEGSPENSGSGDGIYTKVRPVKEKEECAYSVVNIADRDAEYEMIDGKVMRKQGGRSEKPVKSEYEVSSCDIKPKLDPVLFAVEDSGASGIYEDVPESQGSVKPIKENEMNLQDQHNESVQVSKAQEAQEGQKKKWGLTRFSLIKRGKSKHGHDAAKSDKQAMSSGPTTPEGQGPVNNGSGENSSHGKSEITIPARSVRPRTDDSGLPPLPPLENRNQKVDHRRTYYDAQAQSGSHIEKTRTLSGTELGTLAAGIDDEDYDDMYEVPDRDMTKVKLKSNTKSPVSKHPQVLPPSPALLHREVPKPPQAPAVIADEVDGESDGTYDTISCSVHLDGEGVSGEKRPTEAVSGHSNVDFPSTEPEYAVVDKQRKKNVSEEENAEKFPSRNENQNSPEGNKFQVLIRRTTISLGDKGQSHARETKTVEVIETPPPQVPQSSEINIQPHDSVPTPAALDDLYAKVNLEEKHLEESKRALYATVDKPKTGIVKMYSSDTSTDNQEEFEGGHYTRIKELQDNDSTSSSMSRHQNAPPVSSEYEAVDELQFSGMFPNHGSPLKRSQLVSRSVSNKPEKNDAAKADADYEVITQFENVGNKPNRQTPPSNDYEEIVTDTRHQSPRHRPKIDEYSDITDISGIDFKF